MKDLKTEKLFEAFVDKVENNSDRNTRNCPVLRAHMKLLTRLKEENSRVILDDLGFIGELETKDCKECEFDFI